MLSLKTSRIERNLGVRLLKHRNWLVRQNSCIKGCKRLVGYIFKIIYWQFYSFNKLRRAVYFPHKQSIKLCSFNKST